MRESSRVADHVRCTAYSVGRCAPVDRRPAKLRIFRPGTTMLHPEARALLALIEGRGIPPTHTLPPVEARALYRERRGFTQPAAPAVGELRDLAPEGPHGP